MSPESPYPDYSISQGSPRGVITYYALAFSSRALLAIRIPQSAAWLGGVAPIFAGGFMTYREAGLKGITQLIARCGMWRFGLRWYLIAVLLAVVNILLDLLAYRILGGSIFGVPARQWLTGYLTVTHPL